METYALGKEVTYKERKWLVVRIVNDVTLFENPDGTQSAVAQNYVQLRSDMGEPEFIVLNEHEQPFSRVSTMKATPVVPWRVKNGRPSTEVQTSGS